MEERPVKSLQTLCRSRDFHFL